MAQSQAELQEQTETASPLRDDPTGSRCTCLRLPAGAISPQACPTCGTAIASNGGPVTPSTWLYAIGNIEVRFPSLSLEKEFAQATGRDNDVGAHRQTSVSGRALQAREPLPGAAVLLHHDDRWARHLHPGATRVLGRGSARGNHPRQPQSDGSGRGHRHEGADCSAAEVQRFAASRRGLRPALLDSTAMP